MSFKNIFNAMLYGAAVTLGGTLITKAVDVASDPYKREVIKKKFTDLKEELSRKVES